MHIKRLYQIIERKKINVRLEYKIMPTKKVVLQLVIKKNHDLQVNNDSFLTCFIKQ